MTQVFLLVSFLLFICFFRCSWAIIVKNMVLLLPDGAPLWQEGYVSKFCSLKLLHLISLMHFGGQRQIIWPSRLTSAEQWSRWMTLRWCIQNQMYQANKYYMLDTKNEDTNLNWKNMIFFFSKPVFNNPAGKPNIHIPLLHRPRYSYSLA